VDTKKLGLGTFSYIAGKLFHQSPANCFINRRQPN